MKSPWTLRQRFGGSPGTATGRQGWIEAAGRFFDWTLLSGLAAALFYWASFPPIGARFCIWLVPLFWAWILLDWRAAGADPQTRDAKSTILFKVWIAGDLCWLGLMAWVYQPLWWMILAWMLTAAILGASWVGLIVLSDMAMNSVRLPLAPAMAIVWCGLEWCRKNLFGGLPFASLEHSQHPYTVLIQMADLIGESGLGMAIVFVGATTADVLRKPPDAGAFTDLSPGLWPGRILQASAGLVVLLGLVGYGAWRLSQADVAATADSGNPARTIALVQGATDLTDAIHPPDVAHAFDECLRMSVQHGPQADLVVWPESVCPLPWVTMEPGYVPKEWQGESPESIELAMERARQGFARPLIAIARDSQAPVLLNVSVRDYVRDPPAGGPIPTNSLVLVHPTGGIEMRYDKFKLAPLIECDPTEAFVGRSLLFRPMFRPGSSPMAFTVPSRHGDPPFVATANICYDSMFPRVIQWQLSQLRRQGMDPDVIINSSNDATVEFPNAQDLHFATHVFRAVENRKPYLVSSNSGASAWIDACGRVIQRGKPGTVDCLRVRVTRTRLGSLYRETGDVVPLCCAVFACVLVPLLSALRVSFGSGGPRQNRVSPRQ